jgi:dTDP-4-dehydrorhamnose reductase
MRYQRLLDATNSISQLQEFVAASWACWEKRVPFGIYNVTNPGQVTARQVVDHIIESGVLIKRYNFFENESDFMAVAAKTPRSNCVMDSSKLIALGIKMTEVNEAIMRDLKRWRKIGE